MALHPFAHKHPSELTDSDVADIRQALTGIRVGVLRPWADYLLESLTPDQAVAALRHTGSLWPPLAAEIVLSGALAVQDYPPFDAYKHLFEEWDATGDAASKEQEYIESHLSPPYESSLGLLFDSMTHDERVTAIDTCDSERSGLIAILVRYLATFRQSLLLPLLPAIERRTGFVVVEALLETTTPICYEAAFRITKRITDPFSSFLAFRALHEVSPTRHFEETFSAAKRSLEGSDRQNNHHVAAEWLCRYGGADGIAQVVHYLKTQDTMWLFSVAHFSIQALGDRAQPIIEAARESGILQDKEPA